MRRFLPSSACWSAAAPVAAQPPPSAPPAAERPQASSPAISIAAARRTSASRSSRSGFSSTASRRPTPRSPISWRPASGQPLSMADVRESIAHLYGLGRFQDVSVDATRGRRRRREPALRPQSRCAASRSVEFTGTLGLDRGLLRRTIADRYGATPPLGRAADAARTLEALYRDHGYLAATVRAAGHQRASGTRRSSSSRSTRACPATIADRGSMATPGRRRRVLRAPTQTSSAATPTQQPDLQRRLDDLRAEAAQARLLRGDRQPARDRRPRTRPL